MITEIKKLFTIFIEIFSNFIKIIKIIYLIFYLKKNYKFNYIFYF